VAELLAVGTEIKTFKKRLFLVSLSNVFQQFVAAVLSVASWRHPNFAEMSRTVQLWA
jgi:hypothetical protein